MTAMMEPPPPQQQQQQQADFWASGALLAAACGSSVTVFNPTSPATAPCTLRADAPVQSVNWTANLKVLVFSGGPVCSLWSNGAFLGALPPLTAVQSAPAITCCRLSRDSKRLFCGNDVGAVAVWDLRQQELANTFKQHQAAIQCVAVEDDLVASSSVDGAVLLHVPGQSAVAATLAVADGRANVHRCLAFCPSEPGVLAATSRDAAVHLWAVGGGRAEEVAQLAASKHSEPATALAFSHTSAATMYTCSSDRSLLVWDRRTSGVVHRQLAPSALTSLVARDDGVNLGLGTAGGLVYLLDARKLSTPTGSFQCPDREPVTELAWQAAHRAARRGGDRSAVSSAGRATGGVAGVATPSPTQGAVAVPPKPPPPPPAQLQPAGALEATAVASAVPVLPTAAVAAPAPALAPSPSLPLGVQAGRAALLGEGTFRAYMDDAVRVLRDDMRNMHIELVRQFHIQQVEMAQLVGGVVAQQRELAAEVKTLRGMVERLARQSALHNF